MRNKNTCDPIKKKEQKINKLTCSFCNKIFSRTNILSSHLNICPCKNAHSNVVELLIEKIEKQDKQIEKQDKQTEILIKQNELLNKKIDKLAEKESKTININNITQQQNIFNIVPFGKEKFDYITNEEYNEIFGQGFRCLQMLQSVQNLFGLT